MLIDADNYPDGEPPPDGDQIVERCRTAGAERFDKAMMFAVSAGAAAVVAAVVGVVAYCRDRCPTT